MVHFLLRSVLVISSETMHRCLVHTLSRRRKVESIPTLNPCASLNKNKKQHTVAIPTYFIVSNDADTSLIDKLPNKNEGGEICPNLTFLGRFGIKNINGISVAYLSGIYDSNLFSKSPSELRTFLAIQERKSNNDTLQKLEDTKAAKEFRRFYCSKDIQTDNIPSVDILLSSEWARGFHLGLAHQIDKHSVIPDKLSLSEFSKYGRSPIVNKLAIQLCPQYHVSANENVFFRLAPYKSNKDSKYLTRFIALANISNKSQRNVYACNITPIKSLKTTENTFKSVKYTKCPYTLPFKQIEEEQKKNDSDETTKQQSAEDKNKLKRVVHKRTFSQMMSENAMSKPPNHRFDIQPPSANYICYKCGVPGHYINECGRANNAQTSYQSGGNRDDFFFERFGGRKVLKRAKQSGGECWFCLGSKKVETHMIISIAEHTYLAMAKGPMMRDHLLIIPINHLSNSMKFPAGVRKEIDRYLICLEKCYQKENKVLLICDRNLQTQYEQHCYLEVFAVDKEKVDGLKDVLFKEAERAGIVFEVHEGDGKKYNVGSMGYLILHNNGNGQKYVYSVQSGLKKKISLNFLRRVIAIHLEIPDRAEWTACIQQTAQETNQTNRLKDKFKPFDWTQAQVTTSESSSMHT